MATGGTAFTLKSLGSTSTHIKKRKQMYLSHSLSHNNTHHNGIGLWVSPPF